MKLAIKQDVVLSLSGADSDTKKTRDPLVFVKEIVHVGEFKKDGQRINIREGHLDHWKKTFAKMSNLGMKVPVPVEHTRNPEKKRGEVLSLEKKLNSRGIPALYARIKFRDPEAAKLSGSGVSIFVPKEASSGLGHVFANPLEHVAITDYPVIPDLEPFAQALSLSFEPPEKKSDEKNDQGPSLQSIAQMLGVQPTGDDKSLLAAIAAAIQQMKQPQQPQAPVMRPAMPMQRPMPMQPMRPPMGMSLDSVLPKEVLMALSKKQYKKLSKKLSKVKPAPVVEDDDDDDLDMSLETPTALSGSVLEVVKNARQSKIDELAKRGIVTANGKKQLEENFVKGQGVALSHQYDDGYESTIKLLESNGPVLSMRSKTGPQGAVALSKGGAEEASNALVADAERRAKGETNL